MKVDIPEFTAPANLTRNLTVFAAIGAVTVLLGIIISPARTWSNLLLISNYLIGLGMAGILFVAFHYITEGGWSTAIRRIPEAMFSVLPIAALLLTAVLVIRLSISAWFGVYEVDGTFWFKGWWLSPPFFIARTVFYIVAWFLFARAIIATSRRQDDDGDVSHTYRNRRLSTVFMFVFSLTFTFASFDWIMSLEPGWYSTIFGVYNFAGMFLSGLAVISVIVVWLMRTGPLKGIVTKSHLHDLGTLIFAFSCFWGYIWFSQYMLIWYTNLPEETSYFVSRALGVWGPLFLLNFIVNWGIPFLALMSRGAKENPDWLVLICGIIIAGRWLDLYIMISPATAGASPVFGIWEIGILLGGIGVFGLIVLNALERTPLIPAGDPFLEESLHHHT